MVNKTEIARRRVVFTALQYAGFTITETDPDITMTQRVASANNARMALDAAIRQYVEIYNKEHQKEASLDGE